MPIRPIRVPLSNNETDEYEEPINEHRDALAAAAFYIQPSAGEENDAEVGVERDALNNLWLKDSFGTATLTQLRTGAIDDDTDFLLASEPPTPTNRYANIRSGGKVIRETWTNSGTDMLLKSIDYTRVSGKVATEVRKVFAPNGTTIRGQLTIEYTRTGGRITSAIETRNI